MLNRKQAKDCDKCQGNRENYRGEHLAEPGMARTSLQFLESRVVLNLDLIQCHVIIIRAGGGYRSVTNFTAKGYGGKLIVGAGAPTRRWSAAPHGQSTSRS